jgi:hypothetical protein
VEGMAENGENPVANNYPPHVTSPECLAWVTCVETVAHDRSVIVDNFKIKVKTDERHTWRPACTYSASPTAAHMYWHLRGGDDGGAGGNVCTYILYVLYVMVVVVASWCTPCARAVPSTSARSSPTSFVPIIMPK